MSPADGDFKTCPWCGEAVRRAALVCRFCQGAVTERGRDKARRFAEGDPTDPDLKPASPPPSPAKPKATRKKPARTDASLHDLAKALPRNLFDTIVETSKRADEGGERRPIAILFTDLVGCSAWMGTSPPVPLSASGEGASRSVPKGSLRERG